VTRRVRWECPNGHPAVLGPTRPPRDSVVRYCLICSAKTGRLVSRTAPALERQRAAKDASAAAKAAARRERAAKERARKKQAEIDLRTIEGVDLLHEMRRLSKLKAFGGREGRLFRSPPELVITRRTSMPGRYGYAEPWRNRITMAVWPGLSLADARETLVHEMTHIVVGGHQDDGKWHGPTFNTKMTAAFKEAFKVLPLGVRTNSYHGRYAAALKRKEAQG
jgi:hypothetical protein